MGIKTGLLKYAAVAFLAVGSTVAQAFLITTQLTGDPRPENPDGLIVNVSISTTGDTANWIIDINSPLHPDIKLDGFFFNMLGVNTDYSFSNFNPAGWAITSPANNAPGSGGANFEFMAQDPPGPPNAADVTNSTNLTFDMTKLSGGPLVVNDFTGAEVSTSSNNLLGSFQLGAHLQSLTAGNGQSDSGFATGNYTDDDLPPEETIPEPASLGLLGLGLLALGAMRRRKAT